MQVPFAAMKANMPSSCAGSDPAMEVNRSCAEPKPWVWWLKPMIWASPIETDIHAAVSLRAIRQLAGDNAPEGVTGDHPNRRGDPLGQRDRHRCIPKPSHRRVFFDPGSGRGSRRHLAPTHAIGATMSQPARHTGGTTMT